jgi:hypothetical protein
MHPAQYVGANIVAVFTIQAAKPMRILLRSISQRIPSMHSPDKNQKLLL